MIPENDGLESSAWRFSTLVVSLAAGSGVSSAFVGCAGNYNPAAYIVPLAIIGSDGRASCC